MRALALALTLSALACSARTPEPDPTPATAPSTIVSLTFDDTFPDQFQVGALVAARGMHATFYVNSGRVNAANFMTQGQLLSLQQQGNELAGHTVSHADLPTLDVAEERRQICNDRVALLALGFQVSSFAYPFGDANATTEQIVSDCGYDSARGVGDLVTPNSCEGCAFANPTPPTDLYNLKTPDSIKIDTSLATLEGYVTQAEQHGGGWVPLVFHHVCDGCDPLSVSPATLAAFLDWLAARAPDGTAVRTVHEVIGGDVKPGVPGPAPTPPVGGGNLIQNPNLEVDANHDGIPDCWQRGGSGLNTATYSYAVGEDGGVAQRIDVTSFDSGARRLVTRQDLGTCAPVAYAGHAYAVTARYLATSPPRFTVYYRSPTGGWIYLTQSPTLPVTSSYATATFTIPALPAAATSLSVGLSLYDVGSLTMDTFTVVDADTTPPQVALTAPSDGANASGTVTASANASDAGGIDHVDFLVEGSVIGTARQAPFAVSWDTTIVTDSTVGLVARAVDLAGNSTLSPGRLITIANTPPADTVAPVVALTAPADGTTIHGTTTLAATAGDAGGVTHVDFLVDGQLVGTADSAPFTTPWDSSTHAAGPATLTARAVDRAGNLGVSAARSITIDRDPPVVAIASPDAGQTLSGVVAVAAVASDDVAVARVDLFANGAPIGSATTPPYAVNWDTSTVPDGSVALTAIATDGAGQHTTSDAIAVMVANGVATDTTPPVSVIACDAAACADTFAAHAINVSLAATDAGTGVASILYTLDGTVPQPGTALVYAGPFSVAGTTTVSFRAIDVAGNAEAPRTQVVRVDTAAPVTAIACTGAPCVTAFYGGPVTVVLAAADADSGVVAIRYSIDGGPPSLVYAGPFVVGASATLAVSSIDVAGNAEAAQLVHLAIDGSAPAVTIACNGAACSTLASNQPIAITLAAIAQGGSGVAAIRFTLDGTTPTATHGTTYTGPFALPASATIEVLAISGAGVASSVISQPVSIDTVAPAAAISSPAANAQVTGTTAIVAAVSDDVGVARVRFYLDGKQLGTRTATPFKWNWDTTTTTHGSHVLAVQAEDAAGNATRSAVVTVVVH